MKALKRTLALILAVLVFAAVPAFAATITVNKPINGTTYDAYKIFDVVENSTGDSYAYSITNDSKWYSVVSDYLATENGQASGITLTQDSTTATKYNVTFGSEYTDAEAKKFADYLRVNIPADAAIAASVKATSTDKATLTIENGNGYYLIMSSYGASAALVTATDTNAGEIDEKNKLPIIEKKVVTSAEGEPETLDITTSESVGKKVTFYTTVYVDSSSNTDYVVHDTMSEGLTLDAESIKLYLGTKSAENASNYDTFTTEIAAAEGDPSTTNWEKATSCSDDSCTFTVTIKKEYVQGLSVGQPIRIAYKAMVNEKAVSIADSEHENVETNDVVLKVDNTTKTTEQVTVYNYGFDLVKDDSQDVILNGAEFELYDAETEGNKITLVKVTEGSGDTAKVYYRPANDTLDKTNGAYKEGIEEASVIKVGTARIVGLKEGSYWLKETKAPSDDYTLLTDRKKVTLAKYDATNTSGGNLWATLSDDSKYYTSGGVEVENNRGQTIPTTGGIGTTIFYILGAVLLVGAGVILVTRKRMNGSAE